LEPFGQVPNSLALEMEVSVLALSSFASIVPVVNGSSTSEASAWTGIWLYEGIGTAEALFDSWN